MSSHRSFVVLAILLALLANVPTAAGQQPDRNIALATGCDLGAFERARAEFERLQTVKQFRPDQVSAGELTAAASAYVALGERCYQALYANVTEKIDDGGLFFGPTGAVSDPFRTLGLKWGAGSPYVGGQDLPGPGIPGGTVTYSFMPSGVSNAGDIPPADANLAITSLPGFQACFVTDIRSAFAAWTAVANIQFTEVADNGVAFNAHGATGDIRIGSHTFDGVSGTLAHGYYPPPNGTSAAGDVHFDRAESWSCSPGAGLIDIGLVALHEVGHAIGLDHETTVDRVAIMGPFYNQKLTGLLPDDIDGARAIYGPEFVVPSPPFPPSPPSPPPPPRKDDILSDFGAAGLWQLFDGNITSDWVRTHLISPKSIVTGDLDGNDRDEIIADFVSLGIWVKMNNVSWFPLHPGIANRMATGDLDGNGKDEILIDFAGSGLWVWNNNSFWSQLHTASPTNFVTGDMDGGGKMEAIVDFAGFGIWVWRNGGFWQQLHTANSTSMVVGDFDGNEKADVVVNFTGAGIWNYANNATWSHIHAFNPQHMAVGDIDGDLKSDLIADFGPGSGVWKLESSTGFSGSQISTMVSTQLLVGDLNGNGKAEVIANFGANGLWLYADNIALIQIHAATPEALAVGDFNGP